MHMPDAELPQWLENVDGHTVSVLTLDDGECLTADVLEFNDDRDELIVDVITSNRLHPKNGQGCRAILVTRVISCESRSRAEQPWPYSDPCRGTSFSFARFVLMATLFLGMIIGSLPLFFLLMSRTYGIQVASTIVYTLFTVFFTFGATGKMRPYMFTCPAVQTRAFPLLALHVGFLAALFGLQTAVLAARPNLPGWLATRDGFILALFFLSFGLGEAQVFYNRYVLDRAHREF